MGDRGEWRWDLIIPGGVLLLVLAGSSTLFIRRPFDSNPPSAMLRAANDIVAIIHALDEYAINNNGAYPSTLQVLAIPDSNGNSYLEGYNGKIPVDPWKHEYHFEVPTPAHPRPHVWSYGADGKRGGTGDDADIDSEDLGRDP